MVKRIGFRGRLFLILLAFAIVPAILISLAWTTTGSILLPLFGAIAVNERVVIDGNWIFAAGVTAGIDGALRLASILRGDEVAQSIQLYMAYAPEPPFNSGTPETAPAAILAQTRQSAAAITARREATARRVAASLAIAVPATTS